MNIVIVPARSGSKRIKNKNIKKFLGIPIIERTLRNLYKMKIFDKIVVSSESEKILKKISKKFPIIQVQRPKKLSSDYAGTQEVIVHTIKKLKYQNIKYVFCIYPTSIFLKKKHVIKAKKILNQKKSFVFTAAKVNKSFLRSFFIDKKKKLKMFNDKFYKYRTQDLKQLFFDVGQLYLANGKTWIYKEKVFDKDSSFVELDSNNVCDIDYPNDWKLAELIYKFSKK